MFCRHNHATLRSKSKGIFQRHILAFKTIILGSIFYATKIIVCVETPKKNVQNFDKWQHSSRTFPVNYLSN